MNKYLPHKKQIWTFSRGIGIWLLVVTNMPNALAQSPVLTDSILQVIGTTPDASQKAFLYNELAWQLHESHLDSAELFANQALYYAQTNQQLSQIGDAYKTKGLIARYREQPTKAVLLQDSAYHFFEMAKDTAGLLAVINNRGNSMVDLGQCEQAILDYQKAERWLSAKGQYDTWVMIRINHATALLNCEAFVSCIALCKEGLLYTRKNQLDYYSLFFYELLGTAYVEEEDYASALMQFDTSALILETFDDPMMHSAFLNNRALVYMETGAFEQAYSDFKKSDAIDRAHGLSQNYSSSMVNMGKALSGMGAYSESAKLFEKALPLLKSEEHIIYLKDVYDYAADNYELMGEPTKALAYYKQSGIYQDSIFSKEKKAKIDELNTKYQAELRERKLAESNLALLKAKSNQRYTLLSALGLLLFLGGIGTYVWLQSKRKQLVAQKRKVELEYSLLRAQMNPHFIFNALNSIQGFFSANKFAKGNEFLGAFSNLIRRVLDQSASPSIPLNEELETLELYLQIEKNRLKNQLDYQLVIDEDVALDIIQVPPLIFQPFVENAIWHGIAPKTSKGKIELHVQCSENEDFLFCQIKDDGVGLSAKASQNAKKSSKGVKITRERLGKQGSVALKPIYNEKNLPAGVQVDLKIPIFDYD